MVFISLNLPGFNFYFWILTFQRGNCWKMKYWFHCLEKKLQIQAIWCWFLIICRLFINISTIFNHFRVTVRGHRSCPGQAVRRTLVQTRVQFEKERKLYFIWYWMKRKILSVRARLFETLPSIANFHFSIRIRQFLYSTKVSITYESR